MVLLFVGFTIRYLYEYRKYLLDIYYIQNISMCRNTEKKCMHYENGIKDEKNIWKNLSLTWHNQGIQQGMQQGRCLEVYSLVQDGILDPEVGASRVSMSLDDFADAMQKAGYKLPEMV